VTARAFVQAGAAEFVIDDVRKGDAVIGTVWMRRHDGHLQVRCTEDGCSWASIWTPPSLGDRVDRDAEIHQVRHLPAGEALELSRRLRRRA
jgi:hypothetical protein